MSVDIRDRECEFDTVRMRADSVLDSPGFGERDAVEHRTLDMNGDFDGDVDMDVDGRGRHRYAPRGRPTKRADQLVRASMPTKLQ